LATGRETVDENKVDQIRREPSVFEQAAIDVEDTNIADLTTNRDSDLTDESWMDNVFDFEMLEQGPSKIISSDCAARDNDIHET
jgi:hypothetical protein